MVDKRFEEQKERLIELSFLGFQLRAGELKPDTSFGQYLQMIGLEKMEAGTAKNEKLSADEAIKKAEAILAKVRDKGAKA